jgi:hypothetical protein
MVKRRRPFASLLSNRKMVHLKKQIRDVNCAIIFKRNNARSRAHIRMLESQNQDHGLLIAEQDAKRKRSSMRLRFQWRVRLVVMRRALSPVDGLQPFGR